MGSLLDFSQFRNRLIGATLFTTLLVAIGTAGFALMPGWSLADAFFMTAITVSTVGYGEVRTLSDGGRLFANFIIGGGIVSLAIWYAFITATLVEMDLNKVFTKRRTMNQIRRLKDHVIVCGAGRTGLHAIKRLATRGDPYVVIESDAEHRARVRHVDPQALFLEADATTDETLNAAHIDRARGLIAALTADTDNAFVCLAARELNPSLTIVARARSEDSIGKLRKAGADRVVTPHASGGVQMASLVFRPDVTLFADVAGDSGLELLLEQIPISPTAELAGLTLAEAKIPARTGSLVVAIERGNPASEDDRFLHNPGPTARIRPGDHLVVLGPTDRLHDLRRLLT